MTTGYRLKRGENTGLADRVGAPIREGAIMERWYNDYYGNVRSVVEWSVSKGAWVDRGCFAHGGGWSSYNGQDFKFSLIVGHIDETPETLYPAVRIEETR